MNIQFKDGSATDSGTSRRRIAILGGGISGLTAAYVLAQARQSGAPIEEFLIEASDRLGGVIRTEHVDEFVVEAGPDSFLTEKPEAAALCRELGLAESLLGSNDKSRITYILHYGKLVRLPDGLALLVPTRLWPIIKSPLFPLRSKLSIVSEWMMSPPSANHNIDESVADFVRRHFGKAMLENVADPLLAGVYGGDSEGLSARSVLSKFWQMEKQYGSLTRGILKARRERTKSSQNGAPTVAPIAPPLFTTLKNGLGQMVDALAGTMEGARIFMERRVESIEIEQMNFETRYRIRCDGGYSYLADAIIFALPTFECSRLLAAFDRELAESLRNIPYNSAMTVTLGYDAPTASLLPPGFGFLVPKAEKRRLLACTFVHAKFSHRAPAGHALLRCFLGGLRDPEVLQSSNEAIASLVRQELKAILNLSAEPLFYRVHRSPFSMAQYLVGHEEVVAQIQTRISNHPTLAFAGNAYSGIGISDCVRSGRAAAARMLRNGGG